MIFKFFLLLLIFICPIKDLSASSKQPAIQEEYIDSKKELEGRIKACPELYLLIEGGALTPCYVEEEIQSLGLNKRCMEILQREKFEAAPAHPWEDRDKKIYARQILTFMEKMAAPLSPCPSHEDTQDAKKLLQSLSCILAASLKNISLSAQSHTPMSWMPLLSEVSSWMHFITHTATSKSHYAFFSIAIIPLISTNLGSMIRIEENLNKDMGLTHNMTRRDSIQKARILQAELTSFLEKNPWLSSNLKSSLTRSCCTFVETVKEARMPAPKKS